MNIQEKIKELILKAEKPTRYSGAELNMAIKDPLAVDVRFCMCFPDIYEVGMSHLGSKIIYSLANKRADTYCERSFAPWVDMEQLLKDGKVPLFSLETHTPLAEFDILGFTLQYEMSYTNILNMLHLSGIPLRAEDRGEDMPLIAMGGPCACNPEPIAPFADVFLIGDGEESVDQLLEAAKQNKKAGGSKQDLLLALVNLEGFYVPKFYNPIYNEDGTICCIKNDPVAPEKVKRCIVKDLDKAHFPENIIVPYMGIVHDRIMLELFRGCTRGCRFCQAGFIYRPVRERSKENLLKMARNLVDNTGYEEMSLSSLSSGDYSCIGELIHELMSEFKSEKVSVSLPSLRIDSFAKEYAMEIQSVKKSGLTFAPEAGTQRLRDVINKGVTEEDLINSVYDAFSSGWSGVKLYFMIGLPTETYEDLDGIVALAKKVGDAYFRVPKGQRNKGLRIAVSVSTFVPKPCTPFQWCKQDTTDEIVAKQHYLKDLFKGVRGVEYNYHSPKLSSLEAVFSRGDRRLADVLQAAFESGCHFDSWNDFFEYDKWLAAFEKCNVDRAFYAYRERNEDEITPYEHIDTRVCKRYLLNEYKKALSGDKTPDCRVSCNACFDKESHENYCTI